MEFLINQVFSQDIIILSLKNHLHVLGSTYDQALYLPMLEIFGVGKQVLSMLCNTENTTPLEVKVLLPVIPSGHHRHTFLYSSCLHTGELYFIDPNLAIILQSLQSFYTARNSFIQ